MQITDNKLYINKDRILPKSKDYSLLRKKGLEYIEKLSSKLWTDYNVHDPGITILEMLCYAITDLGYRSNYLIQDILAEGSDSGSQISNQFFTSREILTSSPVTYNDYRKILIDIDGIRNGWLEILKKPEPQLYIDCEKSKLTTDGNINKAKELDLRGLYDVKLELEENEELGDLNLFCFKREVAISNNESFNIEVGLPSWDEYTNEPGLPETFDVSNLVSIAKSQKYEGELNVMFTSGSSESYQFTVRSYGLKTEDNRILIENELQRTDKDSLFELYRKIIEKALSYGRLIVKTLQARRNLCEDFNRIKGIEIEQIAVCADIEVDSDADVDEVLAKVYFELENFFSPPVNFYSLEEMLGKGKRTEEIFEGPILQHGFIDECELEKSKLRNVIHISDVIQILMDIEGVVSVKDIMLSNMFNCEVINEGERWCLKIEKGRTTRLSIDRSEIVFYKGLMPYVANEKVVNTKLKELRALRRISKLAKEEYNFPIPEGKDHTIQNYYSIQNDFPLCYGIGIEGLPLSVSELRKAQVKQLKGYLLFYDQMLANYFAQLAHVKDLFAIDPEIKINKNDKKDKFEIKKIKKTYFSHNLSQNKDGNLSEIPGLPNLLKDFIDSLDLSDPSIDIDDYSSYKTQWEKFVDIPDNNPSPYDRENILESTKQYEDRRNRFLDHLMARFAEQFTDYVLLVYNIDKKKASSELINDKVAFLKEYPEISRARGKAFNYKDKDEIWNTDNVSGLKKRVSKLLGINSYERKSLADCIEKSFHIYQEKDTDSIDEYRFRLVDDNGNILLSSSTRYYNKTDAKKEIKEVIKYGWTRDNYEIKKTTDEKFYFNLLDDTGEIIARRIEYFETKDDLETELNAVIKHFLKSSQDCEGFHLIEHILLRPRTVKDKLLSVCVDEDCKNCIGFKDPYSFRITVVVPCWTKRFNNMDFRKHFESTLRMEAPSHVHVKICWVDQESMKKFENKYHLWLKTMADPYIDQNDLSQKQKSLIKELESLRSIYPETRLYDCHDESKNNFVLLNHSIIGTIKGNEND